MTARSWREADPRGKHGAPPASVAAVVHRTHLALAAARWGESFLFCVGGTCTTLAALSLSGADPGRAESLGVALLGGLFCGASWGLEQFEGADRVARRLDRRLRHQGGLVTAWEIERRGAASPLESLALDRERARLRYGEALRAVLPPLALPVVAPLLGAALLALALESRRPPEASRVLHLEGVFEGVMASADGVDASLLAAEEADRLDGETAREAAALARQVRSLVRRSREVLERPEDALAEIDELDGRLSALGPRLARDPELARLARDIRNGLDAARMGLSRIAPERRTPREGLGEGADGGSGVASSGADGTMSAPSEASRVPGDPPSGAEPGSAEGASGEARADAARVPEAATSASAWWPGEYDGIVDGWTELTRRGRDER